MAATRISSLNFGLYCTGGVLEFCLKVLYLCDMYFRSSIRKNPATNAIGGYYRLVENSEMNMVGFSIEPYTR